MTDVAPHTVEMDNYLKDVVQALHAACNTGTRNLQANPKEAEKAIDNCEEILGVIMEGHTEEWVG
jgi:hypothetical protein